MTPDPQAARRREAARLARQRAAEGMFRAGGGEPMPDPLGRLPHAVVAELSKGTMAANVERALARPVGKRPALCNHVHPGTTVDTEPADETGVHTVDTPSEQQEPDPPQATAGLAAWCLALDLRVLDGVVVVHLDGHAPAPVTPEVIAAAYLDGLAEAEHETTYTDSITRARARLAVADLDAALRGPIERTLARERIASERRRRLAAEAEEQARLRAALVAALDAARRSGGASSGGGQGYQHVGDAEAE